MENAEIRIIRAELEHWPNKKTGEIKDMTKIYYAMDIAKSENSVGPSIMKCYKQGNLLSTLNPVIMNKSMASIEKRPLENGVKYVLISLNGKAL